MKEVLILKELEQIKAISHKYRIQVLESFNNSKATAKMISTALGEPHAKVNYHIKALEKVGIVELVEQNIRLGIVEKYYAPVAKSIVVDRSALNSTDRAMRESLDQVSLILFERVSNDFYKSMANQDNELKSKITFDLDFYATPEEIEGLHDKIKDLFNEFIDDKAEKGENKKKFSFANLIVPVDDETK